MNSKPRLYDDGYQDAKLGRAILPDQLFESRVDYQIYKSGYDDAVAAMNLPAKRVVGKLHPDSFAIRLGERDMPFIAGSGLGFYLETACSGLLSDLPEWNYRL